MKIKVKSEDFIVEEVAHFKLSSNGKYYLYKLFKSGWNTLDALKRVAKKNNISLNALSYCGKKDRYADTIQYITSTSKLNILEISENIRVEYVGRTDEKASPMLIEGNKFQIKLRNLKNDDEKKILKRIEEIKTFGFPNYFGEQRFGSYDKNLGFFAEKFLKAHYNGALKTLLCSIHSQDGKEEKERKRFFLKNWGNFDLLIKYAKTDLEKTIFSILLEKPKGFLNAIHEYPVEEISMAFSAYQSYLWNKMLAKILEKFCDFKLPIKEWLYPSYHVLNKEQFYVLEKLSIPVPGIKPGFPTEDVERVYEEVLNEEGLYQARFNVRKYRKVIMKSFMRDAIVIPKDVKVLGFSGDEIYRGKKAFTFEFILPRGSFATVLLKSIEA
jgi:tRNA pseudouridine13 synthase